MVVLDEAHALPLVLEPAAEVLPAAVLTLLLAGRRGWQRDRRHEIRRLIQVTGGKKLQSDQVAGVWIRGVRPRRQEAALTSAQAVVKLRWGPVAEEVARPDGDV